MTRDRKTLSAVFMAVLMVLASGTAVSLAVTGSSTDAGTNAVGVQETTTVDGEETATEGDGAEETTREADEPADGEASVNIDEQESEGEQVVIESATLPEGGFIAIHDSSYAEAPLSSVLGNSVYLEPGTHEDVTVTLARPIEESQTLVAMPHLDTNENQVYDFVLSTGAVDGPYTADGEALVDEANVTVEQETTTPGETTTEEMTTTEDVADGEPTTEDVVNGETTTGEPPAETEQFIFQIEQMNIDEWSFVVGDEETPDRTETVGNLTITDRRVEINLSEILRESAVAQQQAGPMTTLSPEEAEEMIQENLSQDIQTVRFVIRDVTIENVTFVVTAPEDVEIPEPPMTTTTEEEDGVTTTEEVDTITTTEADDGVDDTTTTTEEVDTITTTEADDGVDDTTTTTEADDADDTTTTTEEDVAEGDAESFEVSELEAPESATTGDTITVSATVSNPSDQQATQEVAFRLEGSVVARQDVTLGAGEETTVEFEVDTEGVPAGEYIHGVYTQNFGELANITIEESGEAGDNGTSEGNATTTVEA